MRSAHLASFAPAAGRAKNGRRSAASSAPNEDGGLTVARFARALGPGRQLLAAPERSFVGEPLDACRFGGLGSRLRRSSSCWRGRVASARSKERSRSRGWTAMPRSRP